MEVLKESRKKRQRQEELGAVAKARKWLRGAGNFKETFWFLDLQFQWEQMANDNVGDMRGYYFQYLCNVPVECRMSIVFML